MAPSIAIIAATMLCLFGGIALAKGIAGRFADWFETLGDQ